MTDFDELAKTWDDDPAKLERSRAIAQAIREAIDTTTAMDALEYGAGTGQVSFNLAPYLGHITLADTSQGMLQIARERIASLGTDQFRAVELDLATHDPVPEAFDLIYTVMVLHHIDDIADILAAFHTALRPGGWLAIVDLDSDKGEFHSHDFHGHHGFDRHTLAHQLRRAGFDKPAFSTCFVVHRETDGEMRDFPLFLAVARKPE